MATYVNGQLPTSTDTILQSPLDALLLLEAVRVGMLPRTTRRHTRAERERLIVAGSVFIWEEEESGMSRWTDSRKWSCSRVSGEFLSYEEMTHDRKMPDGLIKSTFSTMLAIEGVSSKKFHVIAYHSRESRPRLVRPSMMDAFDGLDLSLWTHSLASDPRTRTTSSSSRRNSPEKGEGSGTVKVERSGSQRARRRGPSREHRPRTPDDDTAVPRPTDHHRHGSLDYRPYPLSSSKSLRSISRGSPSPSSTSASSQQSPRGASSAYIPTPSQSLPSLPVYDGPHHLRSSSSSSSLPSLATRFQAPQQITLPPLLPHMATKNQPGYPLGRLETGDRQVLDRFIVRI